MSRLRSLRKQISEFYILKVDFKCERPFVLNPVDYTLHCPRARRFGFCWKLILKEDVYTLIHFWTN